MFGKEGFCYNIPKNADANGGRNLVQSRGENEKDDLKREIMLYVLETLSGACKMWLSSLLYSSENGSGNHNHLFSSSTKKKLKIATFVCIHMCSVGLLDSPVLVDFLSDSNIDRSKEISKVGLVFGEFWWPGNPGNVISVRLDGARGSKWFYL